MSNIDYIVSRINEISNNNRSLLNADEWKSEKNPSYPIEIELTFRKKSNVEKLQITCHNYYIPEGLELICNGQDGHKSLGEVKFKKNKSSSDKHEMKTVYLDETCSSIIFKILGCYEMENNADNRVGLMNVEVIGKYLDDVEENALFENIDENEQKVASDGGRYSEEMNKLMKVVESNKHRAVTNENFHLAKQAQIVQRTLIKAKKEISELERDMREAIEEEDYQRAHDLRDEIKTLRANVLSVIDSALLEEKHIVSSADEIPRPSTLFSETTTDEPLQKPKLFTPVDLSPTEVTGMADASYLLPPRPPKSSASTRSLKKKTKPSSSTVRRPASTDSITREKPSSRKSVRNRPNSADSITSTTSIETLKVNRTRRKSTGSTKRENSLIINKFMEKENMIVPAALKGRTLSNLETLSQQDSEDFHAEEEMHTLIPANEKTISSKAASCFGTNTVSKLFSKQWQKRRESITEIKEKLESVDSSKLLIDYVDSAIYVLSRILKDSLYNVYKPGLDLLSYFCLEFMAKHNIFKYSNRLAKSTCDQLMSRANDTKDRRAPKETLEEFVNIVTSNPKLAKAYLSILINCDGIKADRGRVQMIDQALNHYEVPNDEYGLDERVFRKFSTGCLLNGDPEVRSLGKKFFLRLYKNGDRAAAKASLPNGTILRKSPLFRTLLEEMQQMDNMKRVPPSILKNVRIYE